jgi:hypothetical protein
VCAAAVCGLAAPARAQVTPAAGYTPPDDTPTVRVGVTIFTDYTYTAKPTTTQADGHVVHPNSFNVGRAYINVTGNISHLFAYRITPDITRETGTGSSLNGSLTFRLKYAYGQLILDDWMPKGSWIRLGMQQTPWVDFMESVYRYRFQGTIFEDREGFLSSSDFGLSGRYVVPHGYGDVHLGIYNGDTYARADPNDQKAFQVRGTLRPFPMAGPAIKGLRLTAFYDDDRLAHELPRKRFVGALTYEHKYFTAAADFLQAKDQASLTAAEVKSQGWSAWITPRFRAVGENRWGLEGLLRWDDLKPDKSVDAHRKRLIAGLAYWLPLQRGPSAALLADVENVDNDTSLNRPDERRYSVHALLNF